jgi:hypothetical protein
MRLCWDRFAPVPRNAPALPEFTVIHINFIRIMINASIVDSSWSRKEATWQGKLTSMCGSFAAGPWKKGIDSAPAAGKEGMAPMPES